MADVKNLAETLVGLTVKEVQELADFLKSEYGIEPAAAAVVVAADGGGAVDAGRSAPGALQRANRRPPARPRIHAALRRRVRNRRDARDRKA